MTDLVDYTVPMARARKTPPAVIPLGSRLPARREQQVHEAQKLLAQLLPITMVETKLMDKYQVSRMTARKIIQLARDLWAEQAEADPERLREETLNAYRLFYNQAMAKEAFGPAGRAIREMSVLQGVNPEANAMGRAADALGAAAGAIDPDRIRARIDELVSKKAAKPGPVQ